MGWPGRSGVLEADRGRSRVPATLPGGRFSGRKPKNGATKCFSTKKLVLSIFPRRTASNSDRLRQMTPFWVWIISEWPSHGPRRSARYHMWRRFGKVLIRGVPRARARLSGYIIATVAGAAGHPSEQELRIRAGRMEATVSGAEQARAVQIVGEWLTELKRPVTLDEILDRWRQTRPDVSATAVRRALWYLVQEQKARFTDDRRVGGA